MQARYWLAGMLVFGAVVAYSVGLPTLLYVPIGIAAGCLALAHLLWSPTPALATRLAFACFSLGLVLSLGDLMIRSVAGDMLYYRPHERFIGRWPPDPRLSRYRANVMFDGEVHGDLAAMSGVASYRLRRRVHFETDPLGFRNAGPLPRHPLDLVILGDSFAMGSGTSQHDTWDRQFQILGDLKSYNLSLPGSPGESLMNLKVSAAHLPIRDGTTLLWVLFGGNDLDDSYPDSYDPASPNTKVEQARVSFQSFRKRSPARQLLGKIGKRSQHVVEVREMPEGGAMLFLSTYAERSQRTLQRVRDHAHFPRLRASFGEMKRFTDSDGRLHVFVVTVPAKSEVYHELYRGRDPVAGAPERSGFAQAAASLCEEFDFQFHDLTPDLIEAARDARTRGDWLFWPDDTHWNARGHLAAARALYPFLAQGDSDH